MRQCQLTPNTSVDLAPKGLRFVDAPPVKYWKCLYPGKQTALPHMVGLAKTETTGAARLGLLQAISFGDMSAP